jgi:hypothetical protein
MFWFLLCLVTGCRVLGKSAMFWDSAQQNQEVPTAIHTTKCSPFFVHFLLYNYALYITAVLQTVNQQTSTNILLSTPATMHILQINNPMIQWAEYRGTRCWRNNKVLLYTISKCAIFPGNADIPSPVQTCCDPTFSSLQNKNLQLNLSFHHYKISS